jgi:hypothetical protein
VVGVYITRKISMCRGIWSGVDVTGWHGGKVVIDGVLSVTTSVPDLPGSVLLKRGHVHRSVDIDLVEHD